MKGKKEYVALTLVGLAIASFTLVAININFYFLQTTCLTTNTSVILPQNTINAAQIGIICAQGGNAGSIYAGGQVILGNSLVIQNGGSGGLCTINRTIFQQEVKVNVTNIGVKQSCEQGNGILLIAGAIFLGFAILVYKFFPITKPTIVQPTEEKPNKK